MRYGPVNRRENRTGHDGLERSRLRDFALHDCGYSTIVRYFCCFSIALRRHIWTEGYILLTSVGPVAGLVLKSK